MAIKFMNELAKDIKNKGEIKLPDDYVTGEAFEKWLYENDNNIPLSKEAIEKLRYSLLNPDKELLEKRNKYLESINQTVVKNKDGSISIDCSEIKLDDIL